MQVNKKTSHTPWIIASLIVGLLVIFSILELTHVTNFLNTQKQPDKITAQEQKAQKAADNEVKQSLLEDKNTSDTDPKSSDQVTPIVDLTAKKESDGTVTILTRITKVPNGDCALSITNGSKHYDQTADVIYQPEFSSCAGFTVPITSLGKGTWVIKLTITSGGNQYEKTITSAI